MLERLYQLGSKKAGKRMKFKLFFKTRIAVYIQKQLLRGKGDNF